MGQSAFAALEHKYSSADGDIVSMPKSCVLHRPIVQQDALCAVDRVDFAFVADCANCGVVLCDERIVEQIDIRTRRSANAHDFLEQEKFLPGERSLEHAEPCVTR